MNLTCIGFGAVVIVAGILFACGIILPRVWKKASEEERAKVRIKPLSVNIGVMIILCGIILLLKGLLDSFTGKAFVIAMVAWLVISGADIFYISKSKRYRNE